MNVPENTDAARARSGVSSTFRWEKCASEQVRERDDNTSFVMKNQCLEAESIKNVERN